MPFVPASAALAGAAAFRAVSYFVSNEPTIDAEHDAVFAAVLAASLVAGVAAGFLSLLLWFAALEFRYAFSRHPAIAKAERNARS